MVKLKGKEKLAGKVLPNKEGRIQQDLIRARNLVLNSDLQLRHDFLPWYLHCIGLAERAYAAA